MTLKCDCIADYIDLAIDIGLDCKSIRKLSGLPENSRCYGSETPLEVQIFLQELDLVFDLISEQWEGDKDLTLVWFVNKNTKLEGVTPLDMIKLGKLEGLIDYALESIGGEN